MAVGDPRERRSQMSGAVELVDLHPQSTATVRARVASDGIADFLESAFSEVMEVLGEQSLAPAGPPFGRWQPESDGFDAEAGFPVTGPIRPAGRVQPRTLPGGLAATAIHRGSYAEVGATYGSIFAWIGGHGYAPIDQPWECYLDEPDVPEPRTQVYVPCA